MLAFAKGKRMDKRAKYTINGYCRKYEEQFSICLPAMIQYLFTVYYWIDEYFIDHGDDMVLNNYSRSVKRISTNKYKYNTVYGHKNVINVNDPSIIIYKWSFKIIKLPKLNIDKVPGQYRQYFYPVKFGIVSSTTKYPNGSLDDGDKNAAISYNFGSDKYCELYMKIVEGDIINMVLDIELNTLYMYYDDKIQDMAIISNDVRIDKSVDYVMAVSMTYVPKTAPPEIELIDFETIHIHNHE